MPDSLTGTTLILVRHAERFAPESANGDPHLTPAGLSRAKTLARVLKHAGVNAIYTSRFVRTKETAKPLATQLEISPREATEAIDLRDHIVSDNTGQTVLVVGHTDTLPALMNLLQANSGPAIAAHEFDNVFMVTLLEAGKLTVTRVKYGDAS